jgi:anti-sigma factor RsiW
MANLAHFGEEELIWFFYGEAENAAEIDLHLKLCAKCRGEYESLKRDMGALATWTVPEKGVDYGEQVWRSLVRKDASIAAGKRAWWRHWLMPRQLAAVGLSAALVVFAFVAGRVTKEPDTTVVSVAVVRERVLAAALSEHIEQSERTLIELTNISDNGAADISYEQQRAESLLKGNRLYRQAASSQGHTALANVLEDLERVLLDVAHSPGEITPAEVQRLRDRVEDQELLFRLRVLGLRLRELQDEPVRRADKKTSKG